MEDINLQTKLKRKKNAEYQEAHQLRKKGKQQAEFQRLLSEKDVIEKIAQYTAENAKLQELVKNLQEANKVSGKSLKKISTLLDLQNISAVEEEH